MKYSIRYYLFSISSLLLNGCSSNAHLAHKQITPLLPIIEQEQRVNLDNRHVTAAVNDYLKHRQGPLFSQYNFMRTDLDQDGWQDALIYLTAPYGQWCNKNGCTVLVLHAQKDGFTITGEIYPIRPPFYISDTFSNGWRNIIVHVSGRTEKAKDIILRFDGTKYPRNPENIPTGNKKLHPHHTSVFP